jgi:hypothetical protein
MVATSRQQADAERLLERISDLLDEHDVKTSLAALGVAVAEILQRLPPHARLTVARGWTERLLHVLQLAHSEQPDGATGWLN